MTNTWSLVRHGRARCMLTSAKILTLLKLLILLLADHVTDMSDRWLVFMNEEIWVFF